MITSMIIIYVEREYNNVKIYILVGTLDIEIENDFDFCGFPLYNLIR